MNNCVRENNLNFLNIFHKKYLILKELYFFAGEALASLRVLETLAWPGLVKTFKNKFQGTSHPSV